LNKEPSPKEERERSTIKNNIITMTPNGPTPNNENLTENNRIEL
jgi:hypothetical protein